MSMISARHPLLRIALAATVLVGLTALSMPTTLQRRGAEVAPTYTFVDARPQDQLKSKFESLLITNCAYGSSRIGEQDFTPGLAEILNDRLMAKSADSLRGRTVRLVNFTVHLNNAIGLRSSMGVFAGTQGALGVLIDGAMNKKTVTGCAADDLRGGFVREELPNGAFASSPWVAVIDLEIDGRTYHARNVQLADGQMGVLKGANRAETKALRKSARDADIGRAIDGALDKLIAMIAAPTPVSSPQSPDGASATQQSVSTAQAPAGPVPPVAPQALPAAPTASATDTPAATVVHSGDSGTVEAPKSAAADTPSP